MSQLLQKCKRVLSGCKNKSANKLNESGLLDPIFDKENCHDMYETEIVEPTKIPIYNEYDQLQHPNIINKPNKTTMKDTTNVTKNKIFKRSSKATTSNAQTDENNNVTKFKNKNFSYSELYDENDFKKAALSKTKEQLTGTENSNYYQIDEDEIYEDNHRLINLKPAKELDAKKVPATAENTPNLFENNDLQQANLTQSLTEIRDLSTFSTKQEGVHWYLNLIFETISKCIQFDKKLVEPERVKRLNVATAHLLYARNFYEVKIADPELKQKLAPLHPCLIALACYQDSDALRISESHDCVCDSYIFLFSTRLKFCAWKNKLFIFLKRPKRSSFDRLNLIEDLTNCHKLLKEKSF